MQLDFNNKWLAKTINIELLNEDEFNKRMFNFKVISPNSVKYFKQGYIEILNGKDDNEIVIHLFLFEPSGSKQTPKYIKAIKEKLPMVTVTGEYIPEVDSHCLIVTKPGIKIVQKKVSSDLIKVLSDTLGGE